MAAKLALACVDAFDPKARGAFIPDAHHDQSYKSSATYRGDFNLDTTGRCVIFICPSPYNDVAQIFVSNSTNQTNTNYFSIAGSNGDSVYSIGTANSNSILGQSPNVYNLPGLPHSSVEAFDYKTGNQSQINTWSSTPGVFSRVVAASLKVVYTGSTLNDGGTMFSFVEPNHNSLENVSQTSYWSNFTSMKHVPLTNRAEQEISVFPIRDDMVQFSPYVDDIPQNVSNGLKLCYSSSSQVPCGYSVGYYPINPKSNPASVTLPVNGGVNIPAASVDLTLLARKVSKTLYPLCRKDQIVQSVVVGQISTLTTNASGLVTSAISWDPTWNGAFFQAGGILYSFQFIAWYSSPTQWYIVNALTGAPATSLSLTVAYNVYQVFAIPAPIGGIFINGGSGQTGQPFHLEYTIHVEYSGINVQGRMTPNPPDHHLRDCVFSAVRQARDLAGQHPDKTVRSCLPDALKVIGTSLAPSAVTALCSYFGGPAGFAFAESTLSGYKRLR